MFVIVFAVVFIHIMLLILCILTSIHEKYKIEKIMYEREIMDKLASVYTNSIQMDAAGL
jgi:hypothetical protein